MFIFASICRRTFLSVFVTIILLKYGGPPQGNPQAGPRLGYGLASGLVQLVVPIAMQASRMASDAPRHHAQEQPAATACGIRWATMSMPSGAFTLRQTTGLLEDLRHAVHASLSDSENDAPEFRRILTAAQSVSELLPSVLLSPELPKMVTGIHACLLRSTEGMNSGSRKLTAFGLLPRFGVQLVRRVLRPDDSPGPSCFHEVPRPVQ